MGIRASVEAALRGSGPQPFWLHLLRPVSVAYGLLVVLRNLLYDRGLLRAQELPGRVISIGNLTAGGTGKTPVTMEVASLLRARGYKVAILTRGYGTRIRLHSGLVLMAGVPVDSSHRHHDLPDEGVMMSRRLPDVPVIAGHRRLENARAFIRQHGFTPDFWILDDGFQHRRIARQRNIVLVDADQPFGNGRLIPCGILREHPAALRRADLVLLTRTTAINRQSALATIGPFCAGKPVLECSLDMRIPSSSVHGDVPWRQDWGRVLVVAGLGRPDQFLSGLKSSGITIGAVLIAGDHRHIPPEEILNQAETHAAVITTAKDYWRQPEVFSALPLPVFVADLDVSLDRNELAIQLGLPGVAPAR